MPRATSPQDIPRFDENCPHPDRLETGDLLFPRKSAPGSQSGQSAPLTQMMLTVGTGNRKVKDVLGPDFADLQRLEARKGLTVNTDLSNASGKNEDSSGGQVDLSDPNNLYKLLKIIKGEFPELIDQWLTIKMDDFLKHPIAKFFIQSITAKDVRAGFFIGHVAMVIRESDGQLVDAPLGVPYVIEANTTDFSHYRVSVHRYHVEDGSPAANMQRGWSNYRSGMGEKVWHARPSYLMPDQGTTLAETQVAKSAISNAAKALVGRPYGFFDNPVFGDTDRMYCAEFIYKVYQAAAVPQMVPTDQQHWDWVLSFFQATNPQLGQLVESIIDDSALGINRDTPFFLLSPPMLWKSQKMQALLYGDAAESYA